MKTVELSRIAKIGRVVPETDLDRHVLVALIHESLDKLPVVPVLVGGEVRECRFRPMGTGETDGLFDAILCERFGSADGFRATLSSVHSAGSITVKGAVSDDRLEAVDRESGYAYRAR